VIINLTNRVLIKLTGNDVQSFLQGQFSNDINILEQGVVQLNAYCQHQGKIIALIWVMKKNESFYLSFPMDLADVIIKRLTMFKMMSDVQISDLSNVIIQLGIIDENFKGAFKLNQHQSVALVESVSEFDLAEQSSWEKFCVENGIAEVTIETSEQFVPQLLNLDIDEVGVSFTKGCYPGQEVVARLHYLGKSKRRLRMFECKDDLKVGDKLFALSSKSAKASGVVVRRVKLDAKSLCLATIEIAHENDQITLNDPQGAQLIRINHD
jgi:folate-binding protein YgfZ